MRILYLGNEQERYKGGFYYYIGNKINNGFIRNGHEVLYVSEKHMSRSVSLFRSAKKGCKRYNKLLLEIAANFAPDLIIMLHAALTYNETLVEMKQKLPNVKIAQINVDALFYQHNYADIMRRVQVVDASFITTGGDILADFSAEGKIVCYIPNFIDSSKEILQNYQYDNQDYDIFFVAGEKRIYAIDNRIIIPNLIREKLPNIRRNFFLDGRNRILGAAYLDALSNSKMGLNINNHLDKRALRKGKQSKSKHIFSKLNYLYSSDRIAQYMGNGLLTFTNTDSGLDKLFSEDEIVFFANNDDLLEKIDYYLKNDDERRRIAEKGWLKMHKSYNEKLVTQYIIERIFNLDLSHDYAWPLDLY